MKQNFQNIILYHIQKLLIWNLKNHIWRLSRPKERCGTPVMFMVENTNMATVHNILNCYKNWWINRASFTELYKVEIVKEIKNFVWCVSFLGRISLIMVTVLESMFREEFIKQLYCAISNLIHLLLYAPCILQPSILQPGLQMCIQEIQCSYEK